MAQNIRLWINEGLATYMGRLSYFKTVKSLDDSEDWDMFYLRHSSFLESSFPQSLMKSKDYGFIPWLQKLLGPIYKKDRGFDENAVGVVYDKGSHFLRMISAVLGERAFRAGIRKFVEAKQYQSATTDDLWDALSTVTSYTGFGPNPIKKIFGNWIHQEGYPIITITRCYTVVCSNWIKFHQRSLDKRTPYLLIPISYVAINKSSDIKDFGDTKPKLFMEEQEETCHKYVGSTPLTQDTALIVNIRNTGTYLVNYDERNWKLIAKMLKHNYASIHPANRLQIVNTLYALVETEIDRKLPMLVEGEWNYRTLAMCIGEYITVRVYLNLLIIHLWLLPKL